jgi:hypothetical protein
VEVGRHGALGLPVLEDRIEHHAEHGDEDHRQMTSRNQCSQRWSAAICVTGVIDRGAAGQAVHGHGGLRRQRGTCGKGDSRQRCTE